MLWSYWFKSFTPDSMNKEQINALRRFILLMDGDAVAQADLEAYGNAYEHLTDYLADVLAEDITAA